MAPVVCGTWMWLAGFISHSLFLPHRLHLIGSFRRACTALIAPPSLTPLPCSQIHCGFVRPPPGSPPSSSTGFDISEEDQAFMNDCRLVVASAIFNDWDRLHPPQRSKVGAGTGPLGVVHGETPMIGNQSMDWDQLHPPQRSKVGAGTGPLGGGAWGYANPYTATECTRHIGQRWA